MTDLRIDYQLLDQIDASLGRLAGEFGQIQAMQDAGYLLAQKNKGRLALDGRPLRP